MSPSVELIVVDGASPDNTPEVMSHYLLHHPEIRYYREQENSGVDRDFDKAVEYANGKYCWLMTDDDLMLPGAIRRILSEIKDGHDLVVANSEVRTVDFSKVLKSQLLDISNDKQYESDNVEAFFSEVANCLSFIGSVIIRRDVWMARDRSSYFGTLFVHVGVIFQHPPISNVKCISAPLIVIRYGNAMWTSRGFEIWMYKWPHLIWSFNGFSNSAKALVCPKPWANIKRILLFRAIGGYSLAEYRRFLSGQGGIVTRMLFLLIAFSPAALTNLLVSIYCALFNQSDRLVMYDLACSRHASWPSRWVARILGI